MAILEGRTSRRTASEPVKVDAPDAARVVAGVALPLIARGLIIRRPRVVAALERMDADRRAVKLLQRLRDRYGDGPLVVSLPGLTLALLIAPADVRRVLDETPEPFATATPLKRAALSHFQPHGVLISTGTDRAERRRFNEAVLDTSNFMHRNAAAIVNVLGDEFSRLGDDCCLSWRDFAPVWWRAVRRIVLGEGARDDTDLTDMLSSLRADANWMFLRPRREGLRRRFERRLAIHLARSEAGSLASIIAATRERPETFPAQQVPQWLFAFDAAGRATFRALALIASHPAYRARIENEVFAVDNAHPADYPYLRASVLESVRLWPTTPVILRSSTVSTAWGDGRYIPADTEFVVHVPFLHRDDERLPYANRFEPELWMSDGPEAEACLVPFSAGPGECPGKNLVLFTASTTLAFILSRNDVSLRRPRRLGPNVRLPGTLSPFRLRFGLRSRP